MMVRLRYRTFVHAQAVLEPNREQPALYQTNWLSEPATLLPRPMDMQLDGLRLQRRFRLNAAQGILRIDTVSYVKGDKLSIDVTDRGGIITSLPGHVWWFYYTLTRGSDG
jgi:hypothetical protein